MRVSFSLLAVLFISSASFADSGITINKDEKRGYLVEVGEKAVAKNAQLIDKAFEKQATLVGNLMKKIDQLDLSTSVSQTLDLFKGIGLSLRYKYEVEPSYFPGYWQRVDSYKVGLAVDAQKWFLDENTPWVLRLDPETRMQFWQYQTSAKEAREIGNGYTPANFPLNATRAMNRLKPGDLAYMRARLNLNVGLQKSWDIPPYFEVRGSLVYIMSGLFDIYVFRAEDNKVRLRLVARRDRGTVAKVSVGVEDDFSIFGVDVVDNAIVRLTELDELFLIQQARLNQNLYLGDYTLDLNYPEVREAYDELFSKALNFKTLDTPLIHITNPRMKREDVRNMLISNLTRLNDIFREDFLNKTDPNRRRVDRNFAGSNGSSNTVFNETKVGIKHIFRVNNHTIRRDNSMAMMTLMSDGSETTDYYIFPTWARSSDSRGLFGQYKENTLRSSTMIYRSNHDYSAVEFMSAGFYFDYNDRTYRNGEHQDIRAHFQQVLPTSINTELDAFLAANNLTNVVSKMKNVRVSARYFVNEEALRAAERKIRAVPLEARFAHVRALAIQHLNKTLKATKAPETTGGPRGTIKPRFCDKAYRDATSAVYSYCQEVDKLAAHLSVIFDRTYSVADRHRQMDELSELELYRIVGPSVLFQLLSADQLQNAGYFDIKFYVPLARDPLIFTYPRDGAFPDRALYESIFDIQRMMDDVVPDMRLNGDVDNITTKKITS